MSAEPEPDFVRPTLKPEKNADSSQPNISNHAANAAEFNALHKHDGRGLQFVKLLFRWRGSILPRTLPVAMFSAGITVALMIADRYNLVKKAWLPILHHPIAVQMFGVVLGYVVVLRSNVAVDRYFEGITNVQFFSSKWNDAYAQLCGFVRSSAKVHKRENRMQHVAECQELQVTLLHYFSLIHGLAINSLQITQLDLEDDEYFNRVRVRPTPKLDMSKLVDKGGYAEEIGPDGGVRTGSGKRSLKKASIGDLSPEVAMIAEQEAHVKSHGLRPLGLLGALTPEEEELIRKAEDKVDLVHSWIIEVISQASLDSVILTQAPILSRVYQELSNGMLGYNQAYKIALVQFPFAFGQMLSLFLFAFVFCCPVAIFVFTGGEVLTPGLTIFTVMGFWGIHEISLEVENPFGVTSNQLPMKPLHDSMCESLFESCIASLPRRDTKLRIEENTKEIEATSPKNTAELTSSAASEPSQIPAIPG